jgi:hypothetical protein
MLTHFRHDLRRDHRLINELTWNTAASTRRARQFAAVARSVTLF